MNFRYDIFAKDSESNKNIIIENQYGITNHNHLGKILLYSDGLDAQIVIWIAESFREEYETALQWLNNNSSPDSEVAIFGIEVRFVKIDNFSPAPDFRVVIKPSNWEIMRKSSEVKLTERRKKHLDIFTEIVEEYSKINSIWGKVKPSTKNWLGFGVEKSRLRFTWSFRSNNRFNVELYIDTGDKEENERIFTKIADFKEGFKEEGLDLSWEKLEASRAPRIAVYYCLKGSIHLLDEPECKNPVSWVVKTMDHFRNLFMLYINDL